ncbi:hypothetical protein BH10ACT9_BH10ACT9_46110 [soil metagenome]
MRREWVIQWWWCCRRLFIVSFDTPASISGWSLLEPHRPYRECRDSTRTRAVLIVSGPELPTVVRVSLRRDRCVAVLGLLR